MPESKGVRFTIRVDKENFDHSMLFAALRAAVLSMDRDMYANTKEEADILNEIIKNLEEDQVTSYPEENIDTEERFKLEQAFRRIIREHIIDFRVPHNYLGSALVAKAVEMGWNSLFAMEEKRDHGD